MAIKLSGVIPPVVTPFNEDELDLKAYRANLEKFNDTGLAGCLILGSNGENLLLSERESDAVLALAGETLEPDKIFMAGTGRESTRHTIKFTRRAAEMGAQCALVVSPSYFKGSMTDDVLETHYLSVAEASPIPILIYNVPQFTGINLKPSLVARLAVHPNVAGIKDSSGNIGQLSEIVRLCPDDFAVFVGSAPVFYPALCVGAVGGILAVANCAPAYCVGLLEAFLAGDHAKALDMQRKLTPLASMVTTIHGVGGLKLAMSLAGFFPGTVRAPLFMPQGQAVVGALQTELDKLAS